MVEARLIEAFQTLRHYPMDGPREPGVLWPETLREQVDVYGQAVAVGRYEAMRVPPAKPSGLEIDRCDRVMAALYRMQPRDRVILSAGAQLAHKAWRFSHMSRKLGMRRGAAKMAYHRALEKLTARVYER